MAISEKLTCQLSHTFWVCRGFRPSFPDRVIFDLILLVCGPNGALSLASHCRLLPETHTFCCRRVSSGDNRLWDAFYGGNRRQEQLQNAQFNFETFRKWSACDLCVDTEAGIPWILNAQFHFDIKKKSISLQDAEILIGYYREQKNSWVS